MAGFGRREIEHMQALCIYNRYIECYSVSNTMNVFSGQNASSSFAPFPDFSGQMETSSKFKKKEKERGKNKKREKMALDQKIAYF